MNKVWKVLVSAPYMQQVIEGFKPVFDQHGIELIIPQVNERLEEIELLHWVQDIDGAICGDDRFTEEVLEMAPRLKVISKWGTGIDSIDLSACKRRGIAVRNTPNAFSEPVADSVVGYMLCFARNLIQMDRCMKQGIWEKKPGITLRECTLGIIGVGDVGKAVVRRAAGFRMSIIGNDIVNISKEFIKETGIRMVTKETLLSEADFISLNCDLNPTSYHIISHMDFELMKPTAILINTARGPLIDEAALIDALLEHRIAGAALDVFENEPLAIDNPLIGMDNVLLAPHNANSSPEAWKIVHQCTISNLLDELQK